MEDRIVSAKQKGEVATPPRSAVSVLLEETYHVEQIHNHWINTENREMWIHGVDMNTESYEGFDEVIAFNNNILAEVTDNYLKPAKALTTKQQEKFKEDYKTWFLEKEVGNKFPMGEPEFPQEQPQEAESPAMEDAVAETLM